MWFWYFWGISFMGCSILMFLTTMLKFGHMRNKIRKEDGYTEKIGIKPKTICIVLARIAIVMIIPFVNVILTSIFIYSSLSKSINKEIEIKAKEKHLHNEDNNKEK